MAAMVKKLSNREKREVIEKARHFWALLGLENASNVEVVGILMALGKRFGAKYKNAPEKAEVGMLISQEITDAASVMQAPGLLCGFRDKDFDEMLSVSHDDGEDVEEAA